MKMGLVVLDDVAHNMLRKWSHFLSSLCRPAIPVSRVMLVDEIVVPASTVKRLGWLRPP